LDSVAVVRQNFDAFQARDFDGVLKGVAEDWKYIPGPYTAHPGIHYHGHDGYRSMLLANRWRESDFVVDVEVTALDRFVLAVGTARFETPEGEVRSHPTASLHLIRDGQFLFSRGFADEREAVAAVEFTPDPEFKIAFDAAPDPMALLDDEARIVHANRATAALLGLSAEELRGQRIDRFAPPEFHKQARDSWEDFKREGQASGLGSLLDADGRRRLLEFRASSNYVNGRHLVIARRRDTGPRRPDGATGVLTPRQREVLSMLAFGLNGPEAAQRLFVSPATVRTHVQNAMHALGAKTRAQAVAEALLRGELELPAPGRGQDPGGAES
jgi:PAS domain S-box-containing protein